MDSTKWRQATSGKCWFRNPAGGICLQVGEATHNDPLRAWWWRVMQGSRCVRRGRAATREEAVNAAEAEARVRDVRESYGARVAADDTREERTLRLEAQAAEPAPPATRNLGIRSEKARESLAFAVREAEYSVRLGETALEKARALPDHWPSKPGRIERAELNLRAARARLVLAERAVAA